MIIPPTFNTASDLEYLNLAFMLSLYMYGVNQNIILFSSICHIDIIQRNYYSIIPFYTYYIYIYNIY